MTPHMLRRSAILLAILLVSAIDVNAQTPQLLLNSQLGDYVGQGLQQSLTSSEGVFTVTRNFANGVTIRFQGNQPQEFWILDFIAAGNAAPVKGVYEGATRFPFQLPNEPGLSVAGEGRGCNILTGRFEVIEVTYGPAEEVLSFAVDFEQHCEGRSPVLFGSFRLEPGAPTAPTGVIAARVGSAGVKLTWSGVAGATRYTVKRGVRRGNEAVLMSGVTTTSFMDRGAANGQTYYYAVSALNAFGESGNSFEASTTAGTAAGDFDGDGQTDLTVFRPSNGIWFTYYSGTATATGTQWGNGLDVSVPGDYDGDGKTDVAVFRPSNGTWFIVNSSTGGAVGIQWGNGLDLPVPGDYDGDGKTDIAVFRPSTGTWFIVNSGTGGAVGIQWGNGNDTPVPGDYDGDGKTDIAVFRPANFTWFIVYSSTGTAAGIQSGTGVPVPGDYDGDGKADVATFSNGLWTIPYSSTGTAAFFQWGNGNDMPVPADYNGDGKTDIAVFRPSNGTWFIQYSGTGTAAGIQWGNGNDIPILKRP